MNKVAILQQLARLTGSVYKMDHLVVSPPQITMPYSTFLRALSNNTYVVKVAIEELRTNRKNFDNFIKDLAKFQANEALEALVWGAEHSRNTVEQAERSIYFMFLVSIVSSFEAYIQDVVFDVYNQYPETKKLSQNQGTTLSGLDNARKQSRDSTKGRSIKYLEKICSVFEFDATLLDVFNKSIDHCVSVRNVVVHNGGVVDSIYLQRFPEAGFEEGDTIKLEIETTVQMSRSIRMAANAYEMYFGKTFPKIAVLNWNEDIEMHQDAILYFEELNEESFEEDKKAAVKVFLQQLAKIKPSDLRNNSS